LTDPSPIRLRRRPFLVRLWRGYRIYRLVGFSRLVSLFMSYKVHR
jgi:hypothetical protein